MNLQPLPATVLNPELKKLIGVKFDVCGLSDLLYWIPVSDQNAIGNRMKSFFIDMTADMNVFFPAGRDAMTDAILGHVLRGNPTDINGMLDAYELCGRAIFKQQLQALVGDQRGSAGDRQFSKGQQIVVDRIIDKLVNMLRNKRPYTKAMACTDPTSSQCVSNAAVCDTVPDYLISAGVLVTSWIATPANIDQDMAAWLFPDYLQVAFMQMMAPWFVLCFVASFVEGPWNSVRRKTMSFYDGRFATHLIHSTVTDVINKVASTYGKTDAKGVALYGLVSSLQSTIKTKTESEVDGNAVLNMYTNVAKLSNAGKLRSIELDTRSAKLRARRSHAASMVGNKEAKSRALDRARLSFFLWIVAALAALSSALFLILTNRYDAFMLQTGALLVLAVPVIIAGIVIAVVNKFKESS